MGSEEFKPVIENDEELDSKPLSPISICAEYEFQCRLEQGTAPNSQIQFDVQQVPSFLVPAPVASQQNSNILNAQAAEQEPRTRVQFAVNAPTQPLSNFTSSSMPRAPREDFLPADPSPQLHRRLHPSAIHTALCDSCNKKNKTIIQRCQDCNVQFCEICIKEKKIEGNHIANVQDLNWTVDVGPHPQSRNSSHRKRRKSTKKSKISSTENRSNSNNPTLAKPSLDSAKTTATGKRGLYEDEDNMSEDDDIRFTGSVMAGNPIDKEEVCETFRRYHRGPEGSWNPLSQDRETGISQDSSIHGSTIFERGQHRGSEITRDGSMRSAPVVAPTPYQFPHPGFQYASNAYIGLIYLPCGTFPPPHPYQINTGYAPLPGNLLPPYLYQMNFVYAQDPRTLFPPNAHFSS